MRAIAAYRVAGAIRHRAVVLDDAFERLPCKIQSVELRIAPLQQRDDTKALRVVIEATMIFQTFIESTFASMSERRMTKIMRQRQCLGEVFIEAK